MRFTYILTSSLNSKVINGDLDKFIILNIINKDENFNIIQDKKKIISFSNLSEHKNSESYDCVLSNTNRYENLFNSYILYDNSKSFLDNIKMIDSKYKNIILIFDYVLDEIFELQLVNKLYMFLNVSIKSKLDITKRFIVVKNYTNFTEFDYYNKEEHKYLNTLKKIMKKGVMTIDRTKVGTLALFGESFKYNIRNYRLPLFTHRKMFLRGIIEELLFFISGSSNTKDLENKKVNIWKGNTSREFLDSRGLYDYKEGEYGPSYGFNLRHYGAEYKGIDADYTEKGIDQLADVIYKLKFDRNSRRILFTYHNPETLNKIPLQSCHVIYQFNINPETNELSCAFYQRSSDSALALNFNVVSASILVFMLCKICNLKPGKVIHNIGNIHIYLDHLEQVKKFVENKPYNFPILQIEDPNNEIKNIDDFKYKHFKVLFYNSHKSYKMNMAI